MIKPMYFLLAVSLAFAVFLLANALLSLFSSAFLRLFSLFGANLTANRRARIVFAARLFPAFASAILVGAFLLPAYFLYEPFATNEIVGFKLAVPALFSVFCLSFAFYRAAQSWLATRRLMANWFSQAEKIEIGDRSVPVFRIRHKFPVLAVVGAFKPRIFIAEQVFETLTDAEIRAAIAHEKGHLAARDNLKRAALRFCGDLFVFPFNRKFDRVWAENAELAADEYAANSVGKNGAVDLAATIVKISRLVPLGMKPGLPAGLFLVEENCGDINSRVRRLINSPENRIAPKRPAFKFNFNFCFLLACSLFAALVSAFDIPLYQKVHQAVEVFARAMQ